jgi:ribosomal-protein-alanine acetyltransferase
LSWISASSPVTAEITIRPAVEADLPRLAALEAASFPDPWSAALLAGELAHPGGVMLVAGAGGGAPLSGYACFRLGAGEAELLRVAVEPAARNRGIARRLLAAGLDRLRTAGTVSCYLEVRPANAGALAAYGALGFTLCGRRRAYYRDGSDALVLRRDL